MNKHLIILTSIILLLALTGCKIPEISTLPDSDSDVYKSVIIRIRTITESGKEKTKILLGYNDRGDKLVFIGPMNQVLFEILVRGNYANVIIPKRKQCWEGEFRDFLKRWWNIDLSYNEIKALLLEQRVSRKKLDQSGFKMQIIESEKEKYPVRLNLSSPDIRLEFRIYEITEKKGRLQLRKELKNYSKVSLDKMIRSHAE